MTIFPAALAEALREGRPVPVLGWGYPDFLPASPFLAHADLEREWSLLRGEKVERLYSIVAGAARDRLITLTADTEHLLKRVLGEPWREWKDTLPEGAAEERLLLALGGNLTEGTALFPHEYQSLSRTAVWRRSVEAAARPLLLVGCDFEHRCLQRLFHELVNASGAARDRGWLLCTRIASKDRLYWQACGFEIVVAKAEDLIEELARHAHGQSPLRSVRGSRPGPAAPYKGLHYFQPEDEEIFFGREREAQQLVEMVLAHRLVIVTGASGAGKTSLLNAGLIARLSQERYHHLLPLYIRCREDAVLELRRAIRAHLLHVEDDDPSETVAKIVTLSKRRRTPVVVLDQVEEMFTRHDPRHREALLKEIWECVGAPSLLARFVLSLRSDYVIRLAELTRLIPGLTHNVMVVPQFQRDGPDDALSARIITGPAERFRISFEHGLANRIVADLAGGSAEDRGVDFLAPPQVSIVCEYLHRHAAGSTIDNVLYDRLGGAAGILGKFLADELDRFGSDREDAQRILKALVTSEATKEVLAGRTIALRAGLPEQRTLDLLARLSDTSRLLRSECVDDMPRFELAHEYLIHQIWPWITAAERERLGIEQLLLKEVRCFRLFREVRIGVDHLERIDRHANVLRLDEDMLVLLLLSAVKRGRPTATWAAQASTLEPPMRAALVAQILDYFKEDELQSRREAAEAAAQIDPSALIAALQSPSHAVLAAALQVLGGIEHHPAVPEIERLLADHSSDLSVRVLACGALGEIGSAAAVEGLLSAFREGPHDVQAAAVRALGRTDDPRAIDVIAKALTLGNPRLAAAGIKAVQSVRFPSAFTRMLTVGAPAVKEAAWQAAGESWHLKLWLAPAADDLPPADVDRLIDVLQSELSMPILRVGALRFSGAAKRRIAAQLRVRALKAEQSPDERDTSPPSHVTSMAALSQRLEQGCFTADDVTRFAGYGERAVPVLEAVLRDLEGGQRDYAAAVEFYLPAGSGVAESTLADALRDPDPTVRYWACLSAAKRRVATLAEAIALLVDDEEHASFFLIEHGPSIKSAAEHAMDRLRPSWRVWNKPFQSTLRR